MKRVYVNSNNYFIIADNADLTNDLRLPAELVYIQKRGTSLSFHKKGGGHIETIDFADVLDEGGLGYSTINRFVNHIEGRTTGSITFVADETNLIAIELKDGSSKQHGVNGSVTPVEFIYTPPAGFDFLATRVVFFMEGSTNFGSNLFGNLAALTNGWTIEINGVEIFNAKDNKEISTYMFDLKGEEVFEKLNRAMVGRLSFSKFTNGADGITVRDGQSFKSIVSDDLSTLTFFEVRVMGVLKPV